MVGTRRSLAHLAVLVAGCTPAAGTAPRVSAAAAADSRGEGARAAGPARAVDIAWGGSFCALRSDGRVACWGHNTAGSLGRGVGDASSVPTVVAGPEHVVQLEAYPFEGFCALGADRSLWCWGFAWTGLRPTRLFDDVADFTFTVDWNAIGVCARHSDGRGSCMQFATGSAAGQVVPSPFPPAPHERSGIDARDPTLEFGGPHERMPIREQDRSCVLRGRQVYCHGDNTFGELGDPAKPNGSPFLPVPELGDVVSLASWQLGSCAAHATGQVDCWGKSDSSANVAPDAEPCVGDFKQKQTCNRRPSPTRIRDAVQVILQGGALRALTRAGDVLVACSPDHRQAKTCSLGDFEKVEGLPEPLVRIAQGAAATCGLTREGQVDCVGRSAELGDGASDLQRMPTRVPGVTGATMVRVQQSGGACAVLADGTVSCWEEVGSQPHGLRDITVVGDGCALAKDGRVWCWGGNGAGEMGLGFLSRPGLFRKVGDMDLAVYATPVPVPGLHDIVDLASTHLEQCAIDAGGRVWCWGLGVPPRDVGATVSPRLMTGLPAARRVIPGVPLVVLGRDQSLWTLHGDVRKKGVVDIRPVAEVPVPLEVTTHSESPPTSSATSGLRVAICQLTAASEVRCDGFVLPSLPGKFRQLSVSTEGAFSDVRGCAVRDDGHLLCWGAPYHTEQGRSAPDETSRPAVDLLDGVSQVSVGAHKACAVRTDGTVWCWGQTELFQGSLEPPVVRRVKL